MHTCLLRNREGIGRKLFWAKTRDSTWKIKLKGNRLDSSGRDAAEQPGGHEFLSPCTEKNSYIRYYYVKRGEVGY
jgi:hypothetical protein